MKWIFVFAMMSTAQTFAATCETLEENLRKDTNVDFKQGVSYYKCGPEFKKIKGKIQSLDACLMTFDTARSTGIAGYLDSANTFEVHWMINYGEDIWKGWEGDGHAWCGDIKVYIDATFDGDTAHVKAVRARAYDNFFCPGKTYKGYEADCVKM